MRESSQPPCTAAIFGIAVSNRAKLLDAAHNFRSGDFCAPLIAHRVSSLTPARWHEVEQGTPYA
jgi:hypothetical protein